MDCFSNASYDDVRVEIISNTRHAFVVVNRTYCPVSSIGEWGDDVFLVDVWMQNQYKKEEEQEVAWLYERSNPTVDLILGDPNSLRVEATL